MDMYGHLHIVYSIYTKLHLHIHDNIYMRYTFKDTRLLN